ncbi:hypothetical protein BDI4_120197 [Burkholderia diffusa]|nr:hypothetical protein BDI4_120197 [Burkholderia diffusa]
MTRSRCGVTACTRTTCSRRNLSVWRTRVTARPDGFCINPFSLGFDGRRGSRAGAAFDFGRRAAHDRGDAPLFVGVGGALVEQRPLQREAGLDELGQPAGLRFVPRFAACRFAGERAAHEFHLAREVRETCEQGVDAFALRIEMRAAGVGQRIALAVAFRLRGDEADFLEIRERRIHHAGARAIETVRARVERLDQFVTVARLLGDQREQQQLEIVGAELAAARHAVVTEIAKAAASATATERAAAEWIVAAPMPADCLPDAGVPARAGMRTMTVASGMAAGGVVSHDCVLYVVKHI